MNRGEGIASLYKFPQMVINPTLSRLNLLCSHSALSVGAKDNLIGYAADLEELFTLSCS